MLCRRIFKHAKGIGTVFKFTFAQGHGITREEVQLLEEERRDQVGTLCDVMKDEWFIPRYINVGSAFSYETELFAFFQRVGTLQPYVFETSNMRENRSLLSSAILVALSHKSSCSNDNILKLKNKICKLGKAELSMYLYNYFSMIYPKVSSHVLKYLSSPNNCLHENTCLSLYKHLCLHELIRNTSNAETNSLKDYHDALGGIFVSLALFDGSKTAENFVKTFVLNYYSNIDYRDLVSETYRELNIVEDELNKYLQHNGSDPAEVRLVSSDGGNTYLPLYNIGIFSNEECLSMGTGHDITEATLAACNAALCDLMFSDKQNITDTESQYKPSLSALSAHCSIKQKLEEIIKISEIEKSSVGDVNKIAFIDADRVVPEKYNI